MQFLPLPLSDLPLPGWPPPNQWGHPESYIPLCLLFQIHMFSFHQLTPKHLLNVSTLLILLKSPRPSYSLSHLTHACISPQDLLHPLTIYMKATTSSFKCVHGHLTLQLRVFPWLPAGLTRDPDSRMACGTLSG